MPKPARERASKAQVQRVPAADLKKGKIPKALQRKSWKGSDQQLKDFAELVGKIRRGDVSKTAQLAVLGESVTGLLGSKHGKAWKAFFGKHGGDDLVSVEYVAGLPMAELLQASSLPRVTNQAGDRLVVFEFTRLDKKTVGARFHVVDRGSYKGTIIKSVAPLAPFIDPKGGAQEDAQLRMVTAGIPQHAQDLLQEALGVASAQIDPKAPVRFEIALLSSKPAVIRATGAWSKFKWPKGVDVRRPTGILNLLR